MRSYLTSSRSAAPARVIAVLLAAARVAAGGLQVSQFERADPHAGPGRRNRQCADARQRLGVAHGLAVGVDVAELRAVLLARDARHVVVHVAQAGGARRGRRFHAAGLDGVVVFHGASFAWLRCDGTRDARRPVCGG
jgi:hypothetical protein